MLLYKGVMAVILPVSPGVHAPV